MHMPAVQYWKNKNFCMQRSLPKNGLKSIILKYIFSLKFLAWKQTLKYYLQSQENFCTRSQHSLLS